jgi:NAD(P)-dependent dehydrogenase (short-subunit alcohol dehydrogenase family)
VITGTGSGIGRGLALRFAAEGATVVAIDVDALAGRETVRQIAQAGNSAEFVEMDVADPTSVNDGMNAIAARLGLIDVLVTNAGVFSPSATIEDTSEDDWDRVHSVNLRGMFLCIKYAGPHVRRPGGSIITMGSIDGLYALPKNVAYAATKGGVIAMARSIAVDYAPQGIRVNCICPGWIDTPMNAAYFDARPGERERVTGLQPIGRLGTPEDIAAVAAFLASDEAGFIAGVPLIVDGGITTPSVWPSPGGQTSATASAAEPYRGCQ